MCRRVAISFCVDCGTFFLFLLRESIIFADETRCFSDETRCFQMKQDVFQMKQVNMDQ